MIAVAGGILLAFLVLLFIEPILKLAIFLVLAGIVLFLLTLIVAF